MAGSGDVLHNGESHLVVSVKQRLGSSDVGSLGEQTGPHDVDGVVVGSVVTAHLHVELADSAVHGHISELFVHVVLTSSGLVLKHNTVGFNGSGSSFVDLWICIN